MLDCLCFIRKHVLKHDSWNEMYCFKAEGIKAYEQLYIIYEQVNEEYE
jgi:hypothetical protein